MDGYEISNNFNKKVQDQGIPSGAWFRGFLFQQIRIGLDTNNLMYT